MGLIANKHLAKLWDFMVFYNLNSGDHSVDIFEAFLECDEALSELQDQYEHWKTMYCNACGDQDVLKESIRLLDTENRRLRQKVSDQEKEINQRRKEADGLYKALDLLRDEKECLEQKIQQLRKENENGVGYSLGYAINFNVDDGIVNMKTIDQLREDNEKLGHTLQDLQKERDELKKDCAYMTNSRDTWLTRAKHAEAEAEELKKKLDLTQHAYNGACKDRNRKAEAVAELAKIRNELQEALDNIRAELETKVKRMDEITTDRVKLLEENKKLKARTDCLREDVKWYRKHYKEQSDKIRELQAADIRKYIWHGDGNTITITMSEANRKAILNILSSKAFGASPEYMHDFLQEVCDDHYLCGECPLRKCSCDFDNMSDEEIEKWYKIAISDDE